jgi:hypothetical protein
MKKFLFLAMALSAFAVAEAQIAIDLTAKTVVDQKTGAKASVSAHDIRTASRLAIYRPPAQYWEDISETVVVRQIEDGRYALFIFICKKYGKKACKPGIKPAQDSYQPFLSNEPITDISRPEERRVLFSVQGIRYECVYEHAMDGKSYRWVVQRLY